MPDIPNPELAARRVALALLQGGLDHRGGFDEAMTRPPFTDLPPRERAWVRGLAATAFRRLGSIDAALAARLQKPPPPEVTAILRIGAAQLLFRDTPAFAAVATSVELATDINATRPFKGLINAVLRGLARDGLPAQSPEADLPPWIAARWRAAYGEAVTAALAARLAEDPPTDLSLRDPSDAAVLAKALEAEILPGGSLRTWRRGDCRAGRGSRTEPGGCRTPPPPSPPASWPPGRERRCWTCAPPPAARRCNWPPRGRRWWRWTVPHRACGD